MTMLFLFYSVFFFLVCNQGKAFLLSMPSSTGTITLYQPLYRINYIPSKSYLNMINNEDNEGNDALKTSVTNVIGTALKCCCSDVRGTGIGTGFYRNGFCATGDQDLGRHTACTKVTKEFLEYSKSVGNDLSTPVPQYSFPGLQDGDLWCLCAARFAQAQMAGMAPKIILQSTHEKTLDHVSLDVLMDYAIDRKEAESIISELNEQREKLNRLL